MNDELSLYTTDELIVELLRRTTFQGVIVRSHGDYRGEQWHGERRFKVLWNNNLSPAEVASVIEAVQEAFHNHDDQEQGDE